MILPHGSQGIIDSVAESDMVDVPVCASAVHRVEP